MPSTMALSSASGRVPGRGHQSSAFDVYRAAAAILSRGSSLPSGWALTVPRPSVRCVQSARTSLSARAAASMKRWTWTDQPMRLSIRFGSMQPTATGIPRMDGIRRIPRRALPMPMIASRNSDEEAPYTGHVTTRRWMTGMRKRIVRSFTAFLAAIRPAHFGHKRILQVHPAGAAPQVSTRAA